MKRFLLILLFVLVAGTAAIFALGIIRFGVSHNVCRVDNEIASAERGAFAQAAMNFVQTVLGPNPEAAYPLLTSDARIKITSGEFLRHIVPVIRHTGPFVDLYPIHIFFLQSAGGGPNTRTVCAPSAGRDWVAIAVKPGLAQAHVVIAARTQNNDWAFTLWLLPEGRDWRVQSFYLNAASIAGNSPEDMLALARRERDSGHMFNAAMLYMGLRGISNRGPAFQLGILQSEREDAAKLARPPEFQGTPPYTWQMNGAEYRVTRVMIAGIAGKLGLIFMLPMTTWDGNEAADRYNRAFLSAFIATHPDFSHVFGFLVARATKPDNSGDFGTVYQVDKGFNRSSG